MHWCSLRSRMSVGCHLRRSSENTDEHRFSPESATPQHEINMLRCIFCGYCEDACPTEAIVLGDNHEMSYYTRKDAIYTRTC
jgi:NADH-quinone oxidoreductase subunit I